MKMPNSLLALPLMFPMPMTTSGPFALLPPPAPADASAPSGLPVRPAPGPATWTLSTEERMDLARAEADAPELGRLRGGELSNSDLTTILLVVAIVALVIIIV